MKQPSKAERGLTLIELMVAVAIAGILASLSIYSFSGSRQRSECYGTIRELRILLTEARQKAQSSGLPVFLRFERLAGRGISLDGGGKIFMRWERIGCQGSNKSWSECPAANCVGANGSACPIDEKGNLTGTDQTCCESVGTWIEVADTFRIVSGGNLVKGDAAENALNRLCWSGTDSTRKVAAALTHGICAFDEVGDGIPDITIACVDKSDVNALGRDAMLDTRGDGTVSIDALTGLSRIAVP